MGTGMRPKDLSLPQSTVGELLPKGLLTVAKSMFEVVEL